jgi:polysaccharide pyruvyl transferase CsaB
MNALLMGYYGGRNLGDEMMLFCLQRWLGSQNIELTVLSEGAADIEMRHGLRALENVPLLGQWSWREAWLRGKGPRVLAAIARHDALIIGGGDLIRDDRGWKSFFFSMEKLLVALCIGRPVYLVNIGICTPQTWYGRIVLKWALRRCSRIIARDARTVDLCHRLGAGAITEYAPDIVLSLPQLLETNTQFEPLSQPVRKYALVCLRTQANAFNQFAWTDRRIQTLAHALDRLIDRSDIDVVFLPFQKLKDTEDDNRVHRSVVASMKHADRTTIRKWTDDLYDVTRTVRDAELVIAMRLHAAVLACALNRRCILMPYDYKVAEFGQQVGLLHHITADTLESPATLSDVFDASLTGPWRRTVPGRVPPASWETLTLAAPSGEPVPVGCS